MPEGKAGKIPESAHLVAAYNIFQITKVLPIVPKEILVLMLQLTTKLELCSAILFKNLPIPQNFPYHHCPTT